MATANTPLYDYQSKKRILDGDCKGIIESLIDTDIKDLNAEILTCLFFSLSEAFIATAPDDVSLVGDSSRFSMLMYTSVLHEPLCGIKLPFVTGYEGEVGIHT